MILPTKNFTVKIGPFIYEVVYSDDVSKEGNVFGSTHNNNQKIYIQKSDIKPQKQEQTFLHELIHACHFVNGLIYRFDMKKLEELPSEEDVCREDSMTLYEIIKDNPKIFNP